MFIPISVRIGLRYLRGRSGDGFGRFVSRMSALGVMVGVLSLVTVVSVMNGFEAQLKTRMLGVLPQAVISSSEDSSPWLSKKPQLPILSDAGILDITPIVRSEAVLQSSREVTAGMLVGTEYKKDVRLQNVMVAGIQQPLEAGEYHLVVGQQLANSMDIGVGDKVRLLVTAASHFTPLGRIPSQRNFTISGIYSTGSDIDGQLMFADIHDAQRLLRFKNDQLTGWRLYFADPFVVPDIAKRFSTDSTWYWQDWRDQRGELFQAVKMEKNMMALMLGLIIAVAAFNLISALIMLVTDKQSEVAILKTQGMRNRQVVTIFVVQGASSSIVGAFIGSVLGILLATNINSVLALFGASLISLGGQLPVVIEPSQVLITVIITVVLSIISTIYPAVKAAQIHPSKALRYE